MRHLLILFSWFFIYFGSFYLQSETIAFYTNQILFSLLLVYSFVLIDKYLPGGHYSSLSVILVMFLTICFAHFNFFIAIGYYFESYVSNEVYGSVTNIINYTEIIILFLGIFLRKVVDADPIGIRIITAYIGSSIHRSIASSGVQIRYFKIT